MSATVPQLFKIVTVRDDVVIGLAPDDIQALGASNSEVVSAVGHALADRGELTAWQFAVRKGTDGALEYAPHQRVSLLGHDSLRVEPFPTSIRVVAP